MCRIRAIVGGETWTWSWALWLVCGRNICVGYIVRFLFLLEFHRHWTEIATIHDTIKGKAGVVCAVAVNLFVILLILHKLISLLFFALSLSQSITILSAKGKYSICYKIINTHWFYFALWHATYRRIDFPTTFLMEGLCIIHLAFLKPLRVFFLITNTWCTAEGVSNERQDANSAYYTV